MSPFSGYPNDQHFVSVTIFGAASVSCEDRNNINDAGGGETEQTMKYFGSLNYFSLQFRDPDKDDSLWV